MRHTESPQIRHKSRKGKSILKAQRKHVENWLTTDWQLRRMKEQWIIQWYISRRTVFRNVVAPRKTPEQIPWLEGVWQLRNSKVMHSQVQNQERGQATLVLSNKQGIRFKVKQKATGIGNFNREALEWPPSQKDLRGDKGAERQSISPTLNTERLNWSLHLGQKKGSQVRDTKPLKMSLVVKDIQIWHLDLHLLNNFASNLETRCHGLGWCWRWGRGRWKTFKHALC